MKVFGVIVLVLLATAAAVADDSVLPIDDFEHGLRPGWEEKRFEGRTLYEIVPEGTGHVLRATSQQGASGLIYRMAYDPKRFALLSWRWKVDNIIASGDATRKSGDDYAARVYVIFPHWFPPKTRSINYIWANRLPQGEHIPNPFFANAVMVAVESGPQKVGQWLEETRNVYEDYRRIFGEEPPEAGAVAIMTDTDNTGEAAVAYYDDLRVWRRP